MEEKEIHKYKDPDLEELEIEDSSEKDDSIFNPMDLSLIKVAEGKQEIFYIPPGIEVLKMLSQLEIKVNWLKSAKQWLFSFAFFWNAIVSIILMGLLFTGAGFIFFFMIPFMLSGIYMFYASIGYLVNNTYITVNKEKISVEHKPISFLIQRDKHYNSSDIKQLFVRKYSIGKQNDKPVYAYALDLILNNGEKVNLVKQFHSANTARYLEQQIEYFLGIQDVKNSDEYLGE